MCVQMLEKNPLPELSEDLDQFTGKELRGPALTLQRPVMKVVMAAVVSRPLMSDRLHPPAEVIRHVQELQRLSVNPSAEKEKQKTEAKHILRQKQRALSDLFKMLANIGTWRESRVAKRPGVRPW